MDGSPGPHLVGLVWMSAVLLQERAQKQTASGVANQGDTAGGPGGRGETRLGSRAASSSSRAASRLVLALASDLQHGNQGAAILAQRNASARPGVLAYAARVPPLASWGGGGAHKGRRPREMEMACHVRRVLGNDGRRRNNEAPMLRGGMARLPWMPTALPHIKIMSIPQGGLPPSRSGRPPRL